MDTDRSGALGPTFSVDRATLEDADGILGCLQAAFAPYRAQYTPAAYEDTVLTRESVRHRLETMAVLVARNDQGQIIGTVGAAAHGTEGHIRGMGVVPSFQGSGVADRLLGEIESELQAAGCLRITLDTTAPLARAIRFYERHGYARSDAVSDFFGMSLYEYRKAL